jgi:hypothetical protein
MVICKAFDLINQLRARRKPAGGPIHHGGWIRHPPPLVQAVAFLLAVSSRRVYIKWCIRVEDASVDSGKMSDWVCSMCTMLNTGMSLCVCV